MDRGPTMPPTTGQVQNHTVRIEGADDDVVKIVRALSRSYGGIGTHYAGKSKGGTKYCSGVGCQWHKLEWFYRGYFAAEVFDAAGKLWLPCVWELTEASELDVRGLYKRGLVWQMLKEKGAGKHAAAKAVLYGSYEEKQLSPEWDYRSVLMRCYHTAALDLSVKNPMPPRLILPPSPVEKGMQLLAPNTGQVQEDKEAAAAHWNRISPTQRNGTAK